MKTERRSKSRTRRSPRFELAVLLVALPVVLACSKSSKMDALRDALATSSPDKLRALNLPACVANEPGKELVCLDDLANALGSRVGFSRAAPDHASAGAAAVIVFRDGRADGITGLEGWLGALRTGKGAAADALRLAVAERLASNASVMGKDLSSEADARALARVVASSVPGACVTYRLLGDGATSLPLESTPDHASCVQKDLERRDGPGGQYGEGIWRGAMGALTLWRETLRALRIGSSAMDDEGKRLLLAKVKILEDASAANRMPPAPPRGPAKYLADVHGDAGIPFPASGAPHDKR